MNEIPIETYLGSMVDIRVVAVKSMSTPVEWTNKTVSNVFMCFNNPINEQRPHSYTNIGNKMFALFRFFCGYLFTGRFVDIRLKCEQWLRLIFR